MNNTNRTEAITQLIDDVLVSDLVLINHNGESDATEEEKRLILKALHLLNMNILLAKYMNKDDEGSSSEVNPDYLRDLKERYLVDSVFVNKGNLKVGEVKFIASLIDKEIERITKEK